MASNAINQYSALVDMGSNGIRFSINELTASTARLLPTVYQDRSSISLYDAQYVNSEKVPISDSVIQDVLSALSRFKRICEDFLVQDNQVTVVATEATRNASNSAEFLDQIERKVGWRPRLLSKEEEGRLGALGVASSLHSIDGLVLDLGGGSIQCTHVCKCYEGGVSVGPRGSVSLPLGAAALGARMLQSTTEDQQASLHESISTELRAALQQLDLPDVEVLDLYLSGGGLRGWGHLLMDLEPVSVYPIPIVNGYSVNGSRLLPAMDLSEHQWESHRISKRRANQIPAVHLVIKSLVSALAPIKIGKATFCQGGVREGTLYSEFSKEVQMQHPLVSATAPYASPSASALLEILEGALPQEGILSPTVLSATINLLYVHAALPKDIRASSALRCTTSGILAGIHGLIHQDRTLLALILVERYGEKVPRIDRSYHESLQAIAGSQERWWAGYVGCIVGALAEIYPAGVIPSTGDTLHISSTLSRRHFKARDCLNEPGPEDSAEDGPNGFMNVEIAGRVDSTAVARLSKRLKRLSKEDWGHLIEIFVSQKAK